MLGKIVTVTIDRRLGTAHPDNPKMIYPVNYGYIQDIMAPDGEEQDAYILGVDRPVDTFEGEVIAVIHRRDDVEDKWVVAPAGSRYTAEEIYRQVVFQEQFFDVEIKTISKQ